MDVSANITVLWYIAPFSWVDRYRCWSQKNVIFVFGKIYSGPYETHKNTVWKSTVFLTLKQAVHIVTSLV
jgi:hypothetical protein